MLREYVLGNGDLFLITSVVRSRSINVTATKRGGGAPELDAPVIQNIVGGDIKVSSATDGAATVTYKGPQVLAFGFSCSQFGVEDGVISLINHKPSGLVSLLLPNTNDDQGTSVLLSPPGLLSLLDQPAKREDPGHGRANE